MRHAVFMPVSFGKETDRSLLQLLLTRSPRVGTTPSTKPQPIRTPLKLHQLEHVFVGNQLCKSDFAGRHARIPRCELKLFSRHCDS